MRLGLSSRLRPLRVALHPHAAARPTLTAMNLRLGLFAILHFAMWATSASAARLALVIGNDAYVHVPSLINARNDANLIATTLEEAGFEVVGGVRSNLDRKSMWATLDSFQRRIVKGDDVVFYYAGHGVQIGSDSLLLPVDIEAETDDQVLRDSVNLISVQDELKNAKFALLVVDACRNNPFPPKPGRTRSIGESRGLAPIEPAEGNAILLAASRGQTALDYAPDITAHNGLFTYQIVQAMRTPGVDILTALRQVRDRIEDEAKRANHDQRPALVEEMRGTFVLFPNTASPAIQSPIHTSRPSQPDVAGPGTPTLPTKTETPAATSTAASVELNWTATLTRRALEKGFASKLPPHTAATLGFSGTGEQLEVRQLVGRVDKVVHTFNVSNGGDIVLFFVDEDKQRNVAYLLTPGGKLRKAVSYASGGEVRALSVSEAHAGLASEMRFWSAGGR
jgi:hypothetical protein